MSAIYHTSPIEVANRLEQLGWTVEELLEVVGAMVSARNSCTDNDPPSAPGWMAWKEGTRRIREIGCAKGMERAEYDQIPIVADIKRKLQFSVINTDDGTSIRYRIPQNRSKKGPATDRAISSNQGSFAAILDASINVVPLSMAKPQPGIMVSWFLCVYCEGDDFRAELSCPVAVEGGFFTDFSERIVLVGPDDDGPTVRRQSPGDESEFDIPVSRK